MRSYLLSGSLKRLYITSIKTEDSDNNPFDSPGISFVTLLRLAAIGDIEFVSGHALTTLDWIIILVFIVVMAIVMVNVLIAVVTNSFDESMGSSAHVFWASRLLLVYDMTMTWSASGLLSKVASLRKSLGGELNYYRITKEEFEPQGRTTSSLEDSDLRMEATG